MPETRRPTARELIDTTLDAGSFQSWDSEPNQPDIGSEYAAELTRAREKSGEDEAVITGEGRVAGHRVAVIVGEFRFLAGSIGTAAADRITSAMRKATAQRLPLLAAPVSGGTRMQEGTIAFTRMINIVEAVTAHKKAGLPYLVYLRHPTTGGVFATWGSLGHITVAEPLALIGFLGPKVFEALHGEPFPEGVQRAENLFAHGLVDAVLEPKHLRGMITRVLDTMSSVSQAISPSDSEFSAHRELRHEASDPWESVMLSRRSDRPGLRTLLRIAATDVIGLNGTGMGERENASLVALARFGTRGVVVVGLDRHAQSFDGPLGPGALRQARRGMALASELGLPLVTVIDTPGAALSREAEEGGLGGEIARSLADLIHLPVPSVSVVLGQGTGGAAIALFPADRIIAAEHGWLSPLPPEGASVIRHGDTSQSELMARSQGISARQMLEAGLVDEIVEEEFSGEHSAHQFCQRVGQAIQRQVAWATEFHRSGRTRDEIADQRVRLAHFPERQTTSNREGARL